MQGYIKLWRKMKEQSYYGKPNYVALWVHLLLSANHKEKKILWNGEDLIINQGQFITGRKELAKATGIPESTCEDILNSLETRHQIRQQKTTKFRIITILNWSTYQISDIKSNNKATTKRQQSDTNNNDKNEKNLDTIVSSEQSSPTPKNWNDVKKIFNK